MSIGCHMRTMGRSQQMAIRVITRVRDIWDSSMIGSVPPHPAVPAELTKRNALRRMSCGQCCLKLPTHSERLVGASPCAGCDGATRRAPAPTLLNVDVLVFRRVQKGADRQQIRHHLAADLQEEHLTA